jgi:hypothetical protein
MKIRSVSAEFHTDDDEANSRLSQICGCAHNVSCGFRIRNRATLEMSLIQPGCFTTDIIWGVTPLRYEQQFSTFRKPFFLSSSA